MHELALLTLLLLPGWGFLDNFRSNIEDYLVPTVTIAPAINTTNVSATNFAPYQLNNEVYSGQAKATYSLDLDSDITLIDQQADSKLQIASLTKLMTAYVALKETNDPEAIVQVPNFSLGAGDAVAGLIPGDRLAHNNLIAAMLITSGSDAAQSVATINAGSQTAFVAKMNKAAVDLGLTNTHFTNPVGWDDSGNYSSAKDLANLSRVLIRNNFFRDTVGTKAKSISVSGRIITLRTTNNLLGVNGFSGVKTGYTEGAGECLSSLETVDGHSILTVILGSPNRFGETVTANTWTKSHFLW